MNKRDISEVKKLLAKKTCRIDKISGCMVDGDGKCSDVIGSNLYRMDEDEADLYLGLVRKALSGKIGKNLYNVDFPLSEEKEGGKQHVLHAFLNDQLDTDEKIRKFCQNIADNIHMDSAYAILIAKGVYDVPAKAKDGAVLEDASDEVYLFELTCICPVKVGKKTLVFDEKEKNLASSGTVLSIEAPVAGFLYPAFDNRQTNIHASLYYAKKETERHQDLFDLVFGTELKTAESDQKELLAAIVEKTLGRDCDFDQVRSINDAVNQASKELSGTDEPAEIGKRDLKRILRDSGVPSEKLDSFDEIYDEIAGEKNSFGAENIDTGSTVKMESQSVKISMKNEIAGTLETKVIGGREFLLIPIQDDITFNGVQILPRAGKKEAAEAMLAKAEDIAAGKAEYATYKDVFGTEE